MAGAIQSAGSDHWGTPDRLFDNLHAEFGFTVDLAASHAMWITVKHDDGSGTRDVYAPANNRVERWFGPGGEVEDGLEADWSTERGFANPPFSSVQRWTEKAYQESQRGGLVVQLLKVATGRKDWRRYIYGGASEIRFIEGRLSYKRPEGRSVGATFDSAVVIWRPFAIGRPVVYWCDRDGVVLEPRRPDVRLVA